MPSMALHTRESITVPCPSQTCHVCHMTCEPWTPHGLRCANCFRFVTWRIFHHLRHPSPVCPFDYCWFHDFEVDRNVCVCLCRCVHENDSEDSDYLNQSETESLPGNDYNIEPRHVRRYGVSVNAQSDDRDIWFEGQLHHSAATRHDLGIPEESSLTNSENRITNAELADLNRSIEPWEVEAIQHTTDMTFDEVGDLFPEAQAWLPELPDTSSPTLLGMLDALICQYCSKPLSLDMRSAIDAHQIFFCRVCASPIRPRNPSDDPDWDDITANVLTDGLRYCYCRCTCDVPTVFQMPHARRRRVAPNMGSRDQSIETNDETDSDEVETDNEQDQEFETDRPRNPAMTNEYLDLATGYLSQGNREQSIVMAIEAIRSDPMIVFEVETVFSAASSDRELQRSYHEFLLRQFRDGTLTRDH